ncbi:hypothetical protein ACH36K_17975 [Clostridium sp. MB05]|jgi:hypothetical protein
MNNVLNILKYNFGKYNSGISKILYIIAFIILCLLSFGTFIKIPFIGEIVSAINIAVISTFLAVNLIVSIIKFSLQISKEQGKLLFTLPVNSWEYIIAKYIEFAILQGSIVLVVYIISIFSRNSMANIINLVSASTAFGTLIAYIIITSFITIFSSYIHNTALCVLAVIFLGGIIQSTVEIIKWIITGLLPYVYLRIGSFIEIDLISTMLGAVWLVVIALLSVNHLDKKLDIR